MKNTEYLGHFAKDKWICKGHNDVPKKDYGPLGSNQETVDQINAFVNRGRAQAKRPETDEERAKRQREEFCARNPGKC